MARFGDLINVEVPVLLEFFTELDETSKIMHPIVKDVAAALGDKAKIIKIDVEKNNELADALRIKGVPTFIIYKSGEMKWRQSGEENTNNLINRLKKHNTNRGAKSTKGHNWIIIYKKRFIKKNDALSFEYKLKKDKKKRKLILNDFNKSKN